MIHTDTIKGSRRYRYYICSAAQRHGSCKCTSRSIPALEIEQFVLGEIQRTNGADSAPQLSEEVSSIGEEAEGLARSVERIRESVDAGDAEGFVRLMEQGRDYLASRRPPEGA